jgi:hypothetical protein
MKEKMKEKNEELQSNVINAVKENFLEIKNELIEDETIKSYFGTIFRASNFLYARKINGLIGTLGNYVFKKGIKLFINLRPIKVINSDRASKITGNLYVKKFFDKNKIDKISLMSYGIINAFGYVYNNPYFNADGSFTSEINYNFHDEKVASHSITAYNGFFTYSGHPISSSPNNINKTVSIKYKNKEIIVPCFYTSPFNEILEEDFKNIGGLSRFNKFTLIKGELAKGEKTNLAIIAESENDCCIHMLSLATGMFLEDIIKEYFNITKDNIDESKYDLIYDTVGQRLLSSTASNIYDLRRRELGIHSELIRVSRDIKILSERYNDRGQTIKDMVKKMSEDAKGFKPIKYIGVDLNGDFTVAIGPVKFITYFNENNENDNYDDDDDEENFISASHFDSNNKSHIKSEFDLGFLQFRISLNGVYITKVSGSSLNHPHIFSDSKLCTGNSQSTVSRLVGSFDIVGASKIIMRLIEQYNPNSPVNRLRDNDEARSMFSGVDNAITDNSIKVLKSKNVINIYENFNGIIKEPSVREDKDNKKIGEQPHETIASMRNEIINSIGGLRMANTQPYQPTTFTTGTTANSSDLPF